MRKDFRVEEQSDLKLKAVLEYVLTHGAAGSKGIPKTKLFKLVYLGDFSSYYFSGKSISSKEYKRRQFGPVPDTLFALVDDMIDKGEIHVTARNKASLHALSNPPKYLDLLSAEEKEMLNSVCNYWKEKKTAVIVKFTHDQRPWFLTKDGEVIPYQLILQEDHPFKPVA